jgi:TonB family protein
MSESWKQWTGQIVNNEFPLLQYVGGSEHSAVFLTERNEGGSSRTVTIKLVPSHGKRDELQLARWQMAIELAHPHLLQVYAMGRAELGHVPVLYVVAEHAEQNLADVLSARALPLDEARAVLDSSLSVLAYLHGRDLVHGHLTPANILAIGDQVKLSIDPLRHAGEACDGPGRPDAYDSPDTARGTIPVGMSPAADVWSLGMTLVQTLTQRLPAAPGSGQSEPQLPTGLPEPFLDIARHSLLRNPQRRWTVSQIAARLQNSLIIPEPISPLPVARPPVNQQAPQVDNRQTPQVERKKRHSYAIPIAVGLALLVATLAVPRFFRHRSEAPRVPEVATQSPIDQPALSTSDPQNSQPIPSVPGATKRNQNSAGTVPASVSLRSGNPSREGIRPAAKLPAATVVSGEVTQQTLPDVTEDARKSIRGTVRVTVKVDVDLSGSVEGMKLASPSASKYFTAAALEAARQWKFKPPQVAGRNVQSDWSLRFAFTRGNTTVVPRQEAP